MARLLTAIARALRGQEECSVHFHAGPEGPYVCEYDACDSPGLDPREI
jgi:hypothetical protein